MNEFFAPFASLRLCVKHSVSMRSLHSGKLSMFYQWHDDDLVLNIRVQPRAANDGFAELVGEQIKLRITAPPVDGKANRHLIAFLAKTFKVAKTDVSIVSGEIGRNKRVKIHQPAHLPAVIGQER
jgi:uncharacterized protein (TIGR00251 family)